MEKHLCLCAFLLLGLSPFQMTAGMGNCEKALCEQKCRKANPIISKGGHCTQFRYCECEYVECEDELCFKDCVTKDPDTFKGGHCRWGWCKCDTQGWRHLFRGRSGD